MQKKSIEKQGDLKIRGDVLRSARENMGLDREGLAEVVCLKPWHITQMEDTEEHYFFYSRQLKMGTQQDLSEARLGIDLVSGAPAAWRFLRLRRLFRLFALARMSSRLRGKGRTVTRPP
jgi:hypothetical protein